MVSSGRRTTPIPRGLAEEGRELLERLMLEQNMSAKRLARLSGVNDTTILRALKGQMMPSLDVYGRMLAGLGYRVDLEVLYVGHNNEGVS